MDEQIAQIVRKCGWFAANISDHEPPFTYTIGLIETYAHPEFIVFGLDRDNAYAQLAGLIHRLKAGESFAERGVYAVPFGEEKHRVAIRRVHPTQHPLYLGFAMGFCRRMEPATDLEAVQVFWPDAQGKFPFDVGCDLGVYQCQPRLDVSLTPTEIREFKRLWE